MVGNKKSQSREGEQQPDAGGLLRLSDDALYQALSERRRRRLLYILLVEESATRGRLATVLAGWTATDTQEVVTSEDRERILTELDHLHLPVLDEAGLVSYDRESGTVSIGPLDDAVANLISRSVETEPPSRA